MADHTGLIERTQHARITSATARAMSARARQCQWCARQALRGQQWCKQHGPGTSVDRARYKVPSGNGERGRLLFTESAAERMLSPDLEAWPPIARIVAHRPRHTRPVLLADVVRALVFLARGDAMPWAAIVHRMRDSGIMRDSDNGA